MLSYPTPAFAGRSIDDVVAASREYVGKRYQRHRHRGRARPAPPAHTSARDASPPSRRRRRAGDHASRQVHLLLRPAAPRGGPHLGGGRRPLRWRRERALERDDPRAHPWSPPSWGPPPSRLPSNPTPPTATTNTTADDAPHPHPSPRPRPRPRPPRVRRLHPHPRPRPARPARVWPRPRASPRLPRLPSRARPRYQRRSRPSGRHPRRPTQPHVVLLAHVPRGAVRSPAPPLDSPRGANG